ncbi:MAG: RNA methyltransferase [Pirellulales bacterium]|nr:RNA methyltransferase [Pirellulales bacterium]
MKPITSVQNPRIKAAVRLRDGRHRAKQGRFLIDGLREIHRAVEADVDLCEVYVCPARCTRRQQMEIAGLVGDVDGPFFEVAPEVFDKLAFGDRAEGIVAVAERPDWRLEDCALSAAPLVAVIEGIEKPGNIGAVVRSADAAGLDAVILADCRTDLVNPNAIRASLGTVLSFPAFEATTEEALAWLGQNKLPIYAARVDGAVPYDEVDFRPGGAIVLGSEAGGLSAAWSGAAVTPIRLPMLGRADSLNISATAAVLFYETLRQRSV